MPADSTVKDLDDLYRQAKAARRRYEGVWFMNVAYYRGNQWVSWDGERLFRPKLRSNRLTLTDNRIQPVVRTEIAKLTKTRPTFVVTPSTSDEEDLNAANMGEQLMRYFWKHLDMRRKYTKALEWSRVCGAGFLKVFWDPTLGDGIDLLIGPNGQPLPGPNGRALRAGDVDHQQLSQQLGVPVTPRTVNQGDVRVEVRSPFQMLIDPIAEVFSEAEWTIEETVKSVEYVKQRYGKTLTADTPANPGLIESRMGLNSGVGAANSYKGVKIREYWCKPCSAHPKGRRAVWSKDTILTEEDAPYDASPYVMFSGIAIPGQLWPGSIVEQLRGPQDELNKLKSQIAENRNRVANPTILASKQAVQNPDQFLTSLTQPGGTYFYDDTGTPNAVPSFLEPPTFPAWAINEIQQITDSIEQISGQHEVTQATVPAGVTAASAINLLQEADNTRLGPGVWDTESSLAEVGTKILCLAAKYYTESRTIQLAGEESSWEIFDFKGSMLRENTSVEVQAGSAFPESKAAKQAAMQDLLTFFVQSGNPPHGRQLAQFLKDWEVGGAERLLADYTRDETQINRENQRLLQGVSVEINPYDNDQAHIAGHEDEQKQLRYEKASQMAKQIMEQHVQAHRDRVAQQQQAQMQLQMQAQGTDPNQQAQQQQAQQQMQVAQAGQQMGVQQAQAQQQMQQQQATHQQQLSQAQERHQQQLAQARQAANRRPS